MKHEAIAVRCEDVQSYQYLLRMSKRKCLSYVYGLLNILGLHYSCIRFHIAQLTQNMSKVVCLLDPREHMVIQLEIVWIVNICKGSTHVDCLAL